MPAPAREQWWDDVVSVDSVKLNDWTYLLWGDRVRVLERDAATGRAKVHGRGSTGWIDEDALGGEPLLELYIIDVGQGDGALVVTPEGHHLMIDGGHQRSSQQTGKSAADFVDWKFFKDYVPHDERGDPTKTVIRLDAMIASHSDADHYGGLRDLIDREREAEAEELDSTDVTVEAFYHQGLCPQGGVDGLGAKEDGFFVSLLGDRDSAIEGLTDDPVGAPDIRGWYADFIETVTEQDTKAGDPTPIVRLSHLSEFLPGFADSDDSSAVTIRVLAPVEHDVGGSPGLRDIGDEGENKNGHSIALRFDYGDRRVLMAGDLNDRSQRDIMEHYGDGFADEWEADVAKACHHGSHHVDLDFLKGVGALSTVFSSGDANTYDHPRAWVLAAAAVAGRVIENDDATRLKAPLVYSTEVARSVSLKGIDQLRRYGEPQEWGREADDPEQTVSGEVTTSKWRVVLDRDSSSGGDKPPVPATKVLRSVIYGLVNVRTDGQRLLFAVRNEQSAKWAYETLEPGEIDSAFRVGRLPT